MPRIAGVDIPNEKRIIISLTYIHGIGNFLAAQVLKKAKININTRTNKLTSEQVNILKSIIEKEYKVEGDLKREVLINIKRLKDINSYRGTRHKKGLPVRGQRTKTNSRTRRGNIRKTVGSGRKPPATPT